MSEIIASIGGRDVRVPSMSLYELERELVELVQLREVLIEENEPTTAVDEQIAAYIHREIRKVDAIRGYLKHCAMMAAGAKEEAEVQRARAKSWEARADYLKGSVKLALEAAGVKKLEGQTGSLSLRGNGGQQALTIAEDTRIVPEEYCQYSVMMSGQAYGFMKAIVKGAPQLEAVLATATRNPNREFIRASLERGEDVAGCRLEPRGTSVVVK